MSAIVRGTRSFAVDPGIRYATDAERRRARRAAGRRKYAAYKALCEDLGIPTRGGVTGSWSKHHAELRRSFLRAAFTNAARIRVASPHQRWWLERFTLDEIRAMAAGLDFEVRS